MGFNKRRTGNKEFKEVFLFLSFSFSPSLIETFVMSNYFECDISPTALLTEIATLSDPLGAKYLVLNFIF
jgi:hypothetical protein